MSTADKKMEAEIKEFLGEVPKLRKYTRKELEAKVPIYWPQERWHVERCEAPRTSEEIGSFGKRIGLMSKKY